MSAPLLPRLAQVKALLNADMLEKVALAKHFNNKENAKDDDFHPSVLRAIQSLVAADPALKIPQKIVAALINVPAAVDPNEQQKSLDLNMSAILQSAAQSAKAVDDESKLQNSLLPKGESFLLDMATKNIISVDKDGKFLNLGAPASFDQVDTCFNSGIAPAKCANLAKLLLNNDAEGFAQAVKGDDTIIMDSARDEILQLHPDLAVQILRKFGFTDVVVPEGNRNVRKVESVASWLGKLQDASVMKQNVSKKLHDYLDLLVHFVNDNKVILNKGQDKPDPVQGVFATSAPVQPALLKHLPRMPLHVTEPAPDAILRMAEAAKTASLISKSLYLQPFPYRVMSMPGMMVGGGESNPLRSIVMGLLEDLRRKNKKLRDSDKKSLDEALTHLENLDAALKKLSQQLAEYRQWISILPDQQNPELLSIDSVGDILDKYRQCALKHHALESSILAVLPKISSSC